MIHDLNAYQAYERRVIQGEFDYNGFAALARPVTRRLPLRIRFGDLLIRAGMKLKQPRRGGYAMSLTTMAEK
ncbi:MAG: hypothetical protein JXB85_07645 [Anaerolineales bacterium]|nr:hypothetical protein [Anaerolineales bacterium]